ncbi:MAG: helical backbone metal receptor [Sphingomonadaceae bacterium]
MRPIFALILAAVAISASACAPAQTNPQQPGAAPTTNPAPSTPSAFPLTLTDDAGRQVSLPKEPQRIISLSASNTEILFALGLGDRVVGVDEYSDYPPPATEKPRVGSFVRPDMEKVIALEPDLILGTEMHLKGVLPELEKRGLTVLIVNPKGVKGVLDGIKLTGSATGRQAEAETLADELADRIATVESRWQGAEPVRVFFELSPELHTAGPNSFMDEMIRLAGGVNVAGGAGKEWPQMDQEALLLADPEVILLADHGSEGGQSPETVAARPGWQQMSAVKTGRIYPIDPDLTNRPGPRVAEGLELMVSKLHPESR